MDYRLKHIYGQMINGQQVKQIAKTQPKNLTEAYRTVLTERTAFYAKDIASGEEIPDIQGLESLGDVENPQKIKHAITSYSLINPLENLLKSGDEEGKGWHKPPVVGINLNNLAQEFVALGINGGTVSAILKNKDRLVNFENAVKSNSDFNMKDVILDNLRELKLPVEEKHLQDLYAFLFRTTATVALAAVGAGEIAASLLTNAKKGKTGDLVFGKQKVEIKGLGGRIGKAPYAWKNTGKGLSEFLSKLKRTPLEKETTISISLKRNIRGALNKIQFHPTLPNYLDQSYINLINSFLSERNLSQLEKLVNNSGILTARSRTFLTNFIKDTDPKFPLKPTPPPEEDTTLFVDQNDKIKVLLKKLLSSVEEHSKAVDVLDPTFLSSQKYGEAVKYFFLHDNGLTAEQAAEAFVKHAKTGDIDNQAAMSSYGSAITNIFNKNFTTLKRGNIRVLKALIFAYSLAIYAKYEGSSNHFDYFLIVNDKTQESISINTSVSPGDLITNCFETFMSNLKLDITINADERGGSNVFYGPKPPKKSKEAEEE